MKVGSKSVTVGSELIGDEKGERMDFETGVERVISTWERGGGL